MDNLLVWFLNELEEEKQETKSIIKEKSSKSKSLVNDIKEYCEKELGFTGKEGSPNVSTKGNNLIVIYNYFNGEQPDLKDFKTNWGHKGVYETFFQEQYKNENIKFNLESVKKKEVKNKQDEINITLTVDITGG